MKKIFYKSSFLSYVLKNAGRFIQVILFASIFLSQANAQHDPVQEQKTKNWVKTIAETQQAWPVKPKATSEAPNAVWILLDDVGFGAISTFGGLI